MTSPQQKKAALSTLQWIQDKQLLERAQDNERMMAELKAAEQMLAEKRRSSNAPASAPLNDSVELAHPIDDTEARSLGVSKSQTVVDNQELEELKAAAASAEALRDQMADMQSQMTLQMVKECEPQNEEFKALEERSHRVEDQLAQMEVRATTAESALATSLEQLQGKSQQVTKLEESNNALTNELDARNREEEHEELIVARRQLEAHAAEIAKVTKQLREMEISLEWSTASNEKMRGELQANQLDFE